MARPPLPEPDPDTLTVRLPDGTLVLVAHINPDTPNSPLQRAIAAARNEAQGPE